MMDQVYNFLIIDDRIATAGMPTTQQLQVVAEQGYQAIINLAPDDPALPDEANLVRGLGMRYIHIPVAWSAPTKEDFDAFVVAMESVQGQKLLIHCAANMRVTAFFSLYAMRSMGWSEVQADSLMATFWKDYPDQLAPGSVWRTFVDERRRAILETA